jgi:lysyl-tRNA synthetase class 2
MIEKIEPAMEKRGPLIVRRFPPEMAALARLDEEGWADRFEFYWNGLEIANAFNEVTDAQEQRRRWQAEQDERARLGTTPLPQDESLIRALENGLPPTGGIALGLERLYMATHGLKDIRELRLFSTNDLLK